MMLLCFSALKYSNLLILFPILEIFPFLKPNYLQKLIFKLVTVETEVLNLFFQAGDMSH